MTQNSLFELSFCPFGKDIRIIFSATELILKINGARTNLNPIWQGRGYFYPLVLFGSDYVSWIFFQKFPENFGSENWHQSGYFDTLPSSLSLINDVRRELFRWAFFLLSHAMPDRVKVRTSSFSLLHCLTRPIFWPYIHISTNHITPLKYQYQLQKSTTAELYCY